MPEYVLSPYIHSIESYLDPNNIRYAMFHQFTGQVSEPSINVRNLLWAARLGSTVCFDREELQSMDQIGPAILELIDNQFLVVGGVDPFEPFLDHYSVRPIQNPAVTYRSVGGRLVLVRMSMSKRICSPVRGEFPTVFEETVLSPEAEILNSADGSTSLRKLFESANIALGDGKKAVEFLTSPERQLIKLTSDTTELGDPGKPFNSVPRSLYHAARWNASNSSDVSPISEFHQHGIEDANWEFDLIEPTVNHAFRFPSQVLGGLSYGARFCAAALSQDVLGAHASNDIDILEVGGGTGTFACSFLKHAIVEQERKVNFHILELSPALAANQKALLAAEGFEVEHFQQDAVSFCIPQRKFDLIIANEVIADLPISWVRKSAAARKSDDEAWEGEGVTYLRKYGLSVDAAPDSFRINSGVFEFIERSWEHLRPGGTVILTEYGTVDTFPVQILHLSHEEFSIHFGHVKTCAERVGFSCSLISLVEFLDIDEYARVLAGNDQHIICLNHVLKRFDQSLPFAAITETDFKAKFQKTLEKIGTNGPRFIPVRHGYYYGPPLNEFMVLIMNKPQ